MLNLRLVSVTIVRLLKINRLISRAVVNNAYKSLTDPEQATKLKIIVSEAKLMAAEELKRRRKPPTAATAQQHNVLSSGVAITVGESDEEILAKMARAHATHLFVDLDRKRKEHVCGCFLFWFGT